MKLHYIIILFLFLACKGENNFQKKKCNSLALELCQIYGLDQGVRHAKGFPGKGKLIRNIDTLSFDKIVSFVKKKRVSFKKNIRKNL